MTSQFLASDPIPKKRHTSRRFKKVRQLLATGLKMSLAIVFRKSMAVNLFREIMIRSIDSGLGDKAIICSGFFQESKKTKSGPHGYRITAEPGFISALTRHTGFKLETLGIHNGTWKDPYEKMCREMSRLKVNLTPYVVRGFNFHAKVYILEKNTVPILSIVGSSNMTANAFGFKPPVPIPSYHEPKKFNHEADIVLWDSKNKRIDDLIVGTLNSLDQSRRGFIVSKYMPEENGMISVVDRIKSLKEEMFFEEHKTLKY